MKRKGNLWFSEIATRENVEKAALWVSGLTIDNEGNRVFYPGKQVKTVERRLANHFDEMVDCVLNELQTLTYDFGKVRRFTAKEGCKLRQINHLDKHGAVLLCAVMQVCQPYFIEKYIPFTYSSVKGRGLVDCMRRVKRIVSQHPDWYYYQADAHHCYESTKAEVSMQAIRTVFKDRYVLDFFDKMLSLVDGLAIGFSPTITL